MSTLRGSYSRGPSEGLLSPVRRSVFELCPWHFEVLNVVLHDKRTTSDTVSIPVAGVVLSAPLNVGTHGSTVVSEVMFVAGATCELGQCFERFESLGL